MTRTPDDALARLSERPEIAEDVALVAAEVEWLRGLLSDARDAFDECTGDYPKELVAGDEWYRLTSTPEVTEPAAQIEQLRAAIGSTPMLPQPWPSPV